MPLTPAQASAAIQSGLASATMTGMGVPKFALGFGIGLSTWTPNIRIQTVDTGTVGSGKGVPMPISLNSAVLQSNLHLGMASQGLLGSKEPLFVQGLATSLGLLYMQAWTNTAHVGVGVGSGVALFVPPPASAFFIAGFAAAGTSGEVPTKMALALALALENTFRALVLTQPIVGSPSNMSGGGTGLGNII